MLLLKMGPNVPSRARRAPPALRRSVKEDEYLMLQCVKIYRNIVLVCGIGPKNAKIGHFKKK